MKGARSACRFKDRCGKCVAVKRIGGMRLPMHMHRLLLVLLMSVAILKCESAQSRERSAAWGKEGGYVTWQAAFDSCKAEGLRLPSVFELQDMARTGAAANWQGTGYWAVEDSANPARAYMVSFPDANSGPRPKTEKAYVRCHATAPGAAPQFITNGVEWEGALGLVEFQEAVNICRRQGFRLPKVAELATGYQSGQPGLRECSGAVCNYWADGPGQDATDGTTLHMVTGQESLWRKNKKALARCVR